MEHTTGRYSITRVKLIFSLFEVWQEEIDSEGELQVRRRERVAASVGRARAEDIDQRRDSAEAVTRRDSIEVVMLGLRSSYAEADTMRRRGGSRSSPGSEYRREV